MSWILWAILGALATGATAIVTKVGTEKVDSTVVLAIQSVVILVLTWSFIGFKGKATEILDIEGRAWPFILGAGVLTTIAYFCYFRALSLGDASRVAPIDRLSLVFSIVLAAIFLREKVSAVGVAGAAMMAFGAILIALGAGSK